MATLVSSSIGSVDPGTEDAHYSTIVLWEDATDVDLRATTGTDTQHDGKVINETHTTAVEITITGATTDVTHYRRLTTMPGASFRDNASVQTNALRANASNGALLTGDINTIILTINETFSRLDSLQITNTRSGSDNFSAAVRFTAVNIVEFNIFEASTTQTRVATMTVGTFRNCLFVNRGSACPTNVICNNFGTPTFWNCTFVASDDLATAPANAITTSANGTVTFQNCGFFGYAALKTGTVNPTYTTCHGDNASPPTGVTQVTYADQFENINDATRDFRLKTGADMIDGGTTDTTNAAIDIAGTSRPQGAAYDTGCWEFVSAEEEAEEPYFIPPMISG